MTKRMLIDATHAEETRVVVLDGTRLEDFDVETSTKRQLKGNIYLAKVVRVEPSLQAAFVEYGGNRHGFLAFSEIHPDYYQIPVADRQRLIEMQAEDARREEEEEDLELALSQAIEDRGTQSAAPAPVAVKVSEPAAEPPAADQTEDWARPSLPLLIAREVIAAAEDVAAGEPAETDSGTDQPEGWAIPGTPPLVAAPAAEAETASSPEIAMAEPEHAGDNDTDDQDNDTYENESFDSNGDRIEVLPPPETVGGGDQDTGDDQRERRMPPRFLRNYKIQEVIRRRQILLIQVVKEERGTKGAALTTYLSLAGRFGVLMPNSPRGGGISRKITSATDRRRLKEVMAELDIPRGMGMIVRTAGANRPKPEIKRDCEYLLRLWDDIREQTMKSVAPALIYEEASLIKRSIRDVYSRDIDEILVDGEEGWRAAHDFMRMLMPSHAKKVQLWRDGGQPLFAKNQVEAQLDGMLMPTVQLRSGGYLVINQAEALVAIDVNSGRSTRERNIEETALRTNLEAADEVARQLRLRDLAGLIVIDFIDMESKRHNAMVEKRIKEALKNDRARIQIGHISHFGLLEMSRQRLRPSLAETSFIPCPHCGGTGHVRSTENAAIHVLRGIEDEGGKRRSAEIIVHVTTAIALYLLNHKRDRLREIELRYAMKVIIAADEDQIAPQFRIEKVRTRTADEVPPIVVPERMLVPPPISDLEPDEEPDVVEADDDDDDSEEDTEEQRAADAADPTGGGDEAERRRKRRRRRRRGGRRDDQPGAAAPDSVPESGAETSAANDDVAEREPAVAADTDVAPVTAEAGGEETAEGGDAAAATEEELRNRRRGRRGGRRRRRDGDGELSPFSVPGAEQPELPPVYVGPTPADPFGGRAFDIFDVMDQAERAAEARPLPRAVPAPVESPVESRLESALESPRESHVESDAEISNQGAPEAEATFAEPDAVVALDGAEHVPAETPEVAAEIVNAQAPEPHAVAVPEHVVEDAVAEPIHEPAPELASEPVAEVVEAVEEPAPPEPAIRPILVGADGESPAEKKRGWWRR